MNLLILAVSLTLIVFTLNSLNNFFTSLWWLTTCVVFDPKKYTKISYSCKGVFLNLCGLIVGIFGALYWLKIYAV